MNKIQKESFAIPKLVQIGSKLMA